MTFFATIILNVSTVGSICQNKLIEAACIQFHLESEKVRMGTFLPCLKGQWGEPNDKSNYVFFIFSRVFLIFNHTTNLISLPSVS
jgi:hypothetical protein